MKKSIYSIHAMGGVVMRQNMGVGRRNGVRAAFAVQSPAQSTVASVPEAEKLLDIVFVATEVGPWSKTGAKGDVLWIIVSVDR